MAIEGVKLMKKTILLLILIILLTACGSDEPVTLRLMTHDSFEVSEATMTQHPAPSVAQSNGYISFGVFLSNDVFIQFTYNFSRC
jgi:hypothetical protein